MVADSALAASPSSSKGADPFAPRRFVVTQVTAEANDTVTLRMEPTDGQPLEFESGQFTMLGKHGHAEVPISISGDPDHPEVLEHTVRAVGGATRALVESDPGDVLLVRGPYGTGWDVMDAAGGDVVLVAGGIGLAPLRPAILEVLTHRERFGRVVIVYGSRTPSQLLFQPQLERWRGRFDVDLSVTVDTAEPAWRGHVGLVTTVLPKEGLDSGSVLALLCGPEIMLRLTADTLVGRGLAPERIRVSLERNMKCGIGLCGHCQLRELFVCTDGPVVGYDRARPLMATREL